jgi:hypothetical protein
MRAFFTVTRRELSDALLSPLGQRITIIHLAVALLAVLFGWPVAYRLGEARWAPALAWWAYAEMIMLTYLALALPADALIREDEIRPGEWIGYGQASPLAVHLGQSVATLLALLFWLITSLPAALLGLLLSPSSPSRLLALAGFAFLLWAALSQVGAWIGVTIDSRPYRIVAVDLAFTGVMLGSLVVQAATAGRSAAPLFAHPLQVTALILNVSVQQALLGSAAGSLVGLSLPAASPPPSLAEIPWTSLVVIWGGVLVAAGTLTVLSLRQWRQRREERRM